MRKWQNVELKENDVERFRTFLKESEIKFETSEAECEYTHFEVYIDNSEADICNSFLENL